MALVARIKEVGYLQSVDDGQGGSTTVDLSLNGRFYVVAEYFDDGSPSTILETETFNLPQTISVEEAQQRIVEFGQRVRDARVRVNELNAYVGAVIPLD